MTAAERQKIINELLASTHIFAAAVDDLMEAHLRSDLGGSLTVAQLKLLKLVASGTAESVAEVAAFFGLGTAAADEEVDRLVRRGLIRRSVSSLDARGDRLSLGEDGQDMLNRYEAVHNGILENLFRQFMPADFLQVTELLDQLSVDIVEQDDDPRQLCLRCGIYFRDKCSLRARAGRACYYNPHSAGE